ncbi:MAG: phosphate transport regulator [Acidimicrobiales bacterium]|nr:phosphate transport regulator [Acidimicrobiales bacterium]
MRFRLIPTDDRFFDLFFESARNVAEGAHRLQDLVVDFTDTATKHARVVDCERRGDQLTKDILRRLDSSFVTPFDREDIHALAEEIDDVADDMLAVSELLQLVPVEVVLPELKEQADILVQMADEAVPLIDKLRDMKGLQDHLEAIDRLESDGDSVYRRTVARLFRDYEAIEVLKWKDIIEAMEAALNTVEDIANVVESIVLKHA